MTPASCLPPPPSHLQESPISNPPTHTRAGAAAGCRRSVSWSPTHHLLAVASHGSASSPVLVFVAARDEQKGATHSNVQR